MIAHRIYRLISPLFRRGRMRQFREQLSISAQTTVLDIGGTPFIWEDFLPKPKITLFNQDQRVAHEAKAAQMDWLSGDGCNLPLADRSFAVLFSNSTIEHVGTWERQQEFAAEMQRVGEALWVQTPAQEFFLEPHLLTPFVHHFSLTWKRRWLRWLCVRSWLEGWKQTHVDEFLAEVRLISAAEMQALFPDCQILRESWFGLTKSYIAVRKAPSA